MFTVYQILSLVLGFWTWNLLGQGVLAVLAGANRHRNAIYRLISWLNVPVFWLTRRATFGAMPEPYLGAVALFIMLLGRLLLYTVFAYWGWIPDVAAPQLK